jgi:hypothetical protein
LAKLLLTRFPRERSRSGFTQREQNRPAEAHERRTRPVQAGPGAEAREAQRVHPGEAKRDGGVARRSETSEARKRRIESEQGTYLCDERLGRHQTEESRVEGDDHEVAERPARPQLRSCQFREGEGGLQSARGRPQRCGQRVQTDADDARGAVDGVAREGERDRSVSGRERTDCFVARLEGGVREAAAKHPEFEGGLRGATESCCEREGRNEERVG